MASDGTNGASYALSQSHKEVCEYPALGICDKD